MGACCRTVDLNAVEYVGNTDSSTSGGETTAFELELKFPADEQHDSRGNQCWKGGRLRWCARRCMGLGLSKS